MGYNDNGGEVLQMPTPHLDVFRLARFQRELANDWISQRPLRQLPPFGGQREMTKEEVLEQVRQSAKELAEKSPRLEPKQTCDFDNVELEALRHDLEQLMFRVGMDAGKRGIRIHAWIDAGCSGGCEKPEYGDCESPELVLSSIASSWQVYINLKDPTKSLFIEENKITKRSDHDQMIEDFFNAIGPYERGEKVGLPEAP